MKKRMWAVACAASIWGGVCLGCAWFEAAPSWESEGCALGAFGAAVFAAVCLERAVAS